MAKAFTPLMGYEKILYIGTAGAAAATQVLDVVNIKVSVKPTYGKTTSRGDGLSAPITTQRPTGREVKLSFNTLNVPENSSLTVIKAAASNATAISVKVIDVASGVTELDADVYLGVDKDAQLAAEQDQAYEADVTREWRTPVF
jgi:hypothetical protein